MSSVSFTQKGNFSKTEKFLNFVFDRKYITNLARFGEEGVEALRQATPKDSGLTANSWTYRITEDKNGVSILFDNTNIQNGVKIAIILQYGHGTKNGGYVAGRDYINPALRPIFDKIAKEAWKEVTNS